jgi:hypothetical protein
VPALRFLMRGSPSPHAGYSSRAMKFGAVVSVVVALLPVAPVASTTAAHISVPALSPFTVRGTSFRPSERVRLTFSAQGTHTKTVIANARGSFKATFTGVSIGRCDAYLVRAKGSRGSSAFLKVIPECAPQ